MKIKRNNSFTSVFYLGDTYVFKGKVARLNNDEIKQRVKLSRLCSDIFVEAKMIKCPNVCLNGYIKYYPDNKKALFDIRECVFCKGKGFILKKDLHKINEKI